MSKLKDGTALFPIGTVERDTGIGRDTLRIWERPYGFPTPERNDKGERVYSAEQIRCLQRIRRMLDQGLRPGKVVPLVVTRNFVYNPICGSFLTRNRT